MQVQVRAWLRADTATRVVIQHVGAPGFSHGDAAPVVLDVDM
jgi:hypothetical protein